MPGSTAARSLAPLLALPLALILAAFLVVPLGVVVAVSLWRQEAFEYRPDVTLENYRMLLGSGVVWRVLVDTLRRALFTYAIVAPLGIAIAWFLAFEVRSARLRMALMVLLTIPFLTSQTIRAMAWLPLLGRNGLVNDALVGSGLTAAPVDGLLYSDTAIILAFVHLHTLFMIAPVLNAMLRIDPRVIEAAQGLGASPVRVATRVVLPLARSGIVVGSVFVVVLALGDSATVQLMGGGQAGSFGLWIASQMAQLQYPAAAASASILLLISLCLVGAMLLLVDIRRQL